MNEIGCVLVVPLGIAVCNRSVVLDVVMAREIVQGEQAGLPEEEDASPGKEGGEGVREVIAFDERIGEDRSGEFPAVVWAN